MLSITMATLWLPYPGFLTARKIEFPVQFNRGFRVVSAECGRRDLGVAAGTILQRLALEAAVALWDFLGTGQHLQFPLQLEVGLPLLSQLHIFHVKHHGQQSHLWSLQNLTCHQDTFFFLNSQNESKYHFNYTADMCCTIKFLPVCVKINFLLI